MKEGHYLNYRLTKSRTRAAYGSHISSSAPILTDFATSDHWTLVHVIESRAIPAST